MTVKLKNYCGYFAIVCTIVILCFSSCSNKENIIDDEPTVDASLMPFVGYWYNDKPLLLFDDGTGYYIDGYNYYECTWGFNNNTQLFSITWLGQTRTLSLVKWDETTIMGVNISTNKSYTYTKKNNHPDVPACLLSVHSHFVSTQNDTLTTKQSYYTLVLATTTGDDDCIIEFKDAEANEGEGEYGFGLYGAYFQDYRYHTSYKLRDGTLTINNPFHPSKTTFTFKQTKGYYYLDWIFIIDGTYKVLDE